MYTVYYGDLNVFVELSIGPGLPVSNFTLLASASGLEGWHLGVGLSHLLQFTPEFSLESR
jgi:hypothetical protein